MEDKTDQIVDVGFEPVPFEDLAGLPILVVDDLQLLRQLIRNYLEKEGFTNIHTASDGREAIDKVEKLNPALVVLDILMPELDGFDVCRILRANKAYDDIPIIIQTGLEDTGDRLRIFQEGANDLLIKPINGAELVARTKVHLQNSLLQSKLRAYQARMTQELNAALQVQSSLMPDENKIQRVEKDTKLTIGAKYLPSSELGGDLWGLETLGDWKVAVYSVDFTGHGVASALNTFRLHTFLSDSDWNWEDPVIWLENLNQRLCKVLGIGQFATVFYAVIDNLNRSLKYASAGAPPVVLYSATDSRSTFLETAGLPIGISKSATYEAYEYRFTEGSQLIIYSDALIETTDQDGNILDDQQLLTLSTDLQKFTTGPDKINEIMARFPGKDLERLPDDLTLITVSN